jgi:hypothetical protein
MSLRFLTLVSSQPSTQTQAEASTSTSTYLVAPSTMLGELSEQTSAWASQLALHVVQLKSMEVQMQMLQDQCVSVSNLSCLR